MTKQLTRREIEGVVDDLLRDHDIQSVPIPIEAIARSKGLPIVETEMDADVSGALIRGGSLQGIAVNAAQSPTRKRFTIAHELGHFLLNHVDQDHLDWEFTVIRRDRRSSEAEDDQEIAANFFAASVLMPKQILRSDVEQHTRYGGEISLDESDILILAKKYKVSGDAMRYRLQNLGFLSWA